MANVNDLQKQLDEVTEAISAVMAGGQSYKIGSRSVTRANLTELRKVQKDLQAQIQAQQSSGLLDDCYVGIFDGR